jgi:hypothetical protein
MTLGSNEQILHKADFCLDIKRAKSVAVAKCYAIDSGEVTEAVELHRSPSIHRTGSTVHLASRSIPVSVVLFTDVAGGVVAEAHSRL